MLINANEKHTGASIDFEDYSFFDFKKDEDIIYQNIKLEKSTNREIIPSKKLLTREEIEVGGVCHGEVPRSSFEQMSSYCLKKKLNLSQALIACFASATRSVLDADDFFGMLIDGGRLTRNKINTHGPMLQFKLINLTLGINYSVKNLYCQANEALKAYDAETFLIAIYRKLIGFILSDKKIKRVWKWINLFASILLRVIGYNKNKVMAIITYFCALAQLSTGFDSRESKKTNEIPAFYVLNIYPELVQGDDELYTKELSNYHLEVIEPNKKDINAFIQVIFKLSKSGGYEISISSPLTPQLAELLIEKTIDNINKFSSKFNEENN